MTYHTLLEQAKLIAPGNTRSANDWLIRLAEVLKAGELMPSERSYLYRLRRVWRRRASGQDSRWNVHGSRAGARPIPRPIAPLVSPQPPRAPLSTTSTLEVAHEALSATQAPRRDSPPAGKPSLPAPQPPVSALLDKYR